MNFPAKIIIHLCSIIFFISLTISTYGTDVFKEIDSIPGIKKIKDFIIYEDPDFYASFPSVIKKKKMGKY